MSTPFPSTSPFGPAGPTGTSYGIRFYGRERIIGEGADDDTFPFTLGGALIELVLCERFEVVTCSHDAPCGTTTRPGPIQGGMQRSEHNNALETRARAPHAAATARRRASGPRPARLCSSARRAIAVACTTATRDVPHTTVRSLQRTHRMRPGTPPGSTHDAHTHPDTTTDENAHTSAPAHDDRTARTLDDDGTARAGSRRAARLRTPCAL